jgi:hypothetical protein
MGWIAGAFFMTLSGEPKQVRAFGGASAYGRLLLGFRVGISQRTDAISLPCDSK